jgi:hypothetical protein
MGQKYSNSQLSDLESDALPYGKREQWDNETLGNWTVDSEQWTCGQWIMEQWDNRTVGQSTMGHWTNEQ